MSPQSISVPHTYHTQRGQPETGAQGRPTATGAVLMVTMSDKAHVRMWRVEELEGGLRLHWRAGGARRALQTAIGGCANPQEMGVIGWLETNRGTRLR